MYVCMYVSEKTSRTRVLSNDITLRLKQAFLREINLAPFNFLTVSVTMNGICERVTDAFSLPLSQEN